MDEPLADVSVEESEEATVLDESEMKETFSSTFLPHNWWAIDAAGPTLEDSPRPFAVSFELSFTKGTLRSIIKKSCLKGDRFLKETDIEKNEVNKKK